MYNSTKLKVWTLITHFFIVVGAGHGIGCLGMIELAGFSDMAAAEFTFSLWQPFRNSWHSVAVSSILGQAVLLLSIFLKGKKSKTIGHMAGLLVLWTSIYYFTHNNEYPGSIHYSFFFCLPFFICSIFPLLPFIFTPVKRLYNWIQS
jgi:hypothetical protein